jgi:hypothetical protein
MPSPVTKAPQKAPEREESALDKFKRLKREAMRGIRPIDVALKLFPQRQVETEEADRSWKVRVPDGHLHVVGPLLSLLENPKDKRYSGAGGIDMHCILSGKARDDRGAFVAAAKALTASFMPWVDDNKIPFADRMSRLERMVKDNALTHVQSPVNKAVGPVELPGKSLDEGDSKAVYSYMVEKRGLPPEHVKAAMANNAFYAARMESKIQGRRGPLNVIFPLIEYRTGKVVSFSRRSIFGDTKKNKGAKLTAGYIVGDFRNASSLFVVESPIEARSRYVLLQQQLKDQSLLNSCCVVGVNGSGRQTELLAVAKKLGYKQVFAGYNNDPAGREFNKRLVEDARGIGLKANADVVPGGEILVEALPHARSNAIHAGLKEWVAKNNIPSVALEKTTRERWQIPNSASACDQVEAIRQQRVGYFSIRGTSTEPLLVTARDDLAVQAKNASKPCTLKDDPKSHEWRITLLRDNDTEAMVNVWANTLKANPQTKPLLEDFRRQCLFVEFVPLINFDFLNKDFNDCLKENNAIASGITEGVNGRKFMEPLTFPDRARELVREAKLARAREKGAFCPTIVAAPPSSEPERSPSDDVDVPMP